MVSTQKNSESVTRAIIAIVMLVVCYALVHTAWISDDAFITFRTVDNFVHGLGLVWNVGEKVQTYTNPLWMLVISILYFFSHEIYYTTIFFSLGLSLLAIYTLLFDLQKNLIMSLLVGMTLLSSHAFVDFTTSGLENPLTYVLIIVWVGLYLHGDISMLKKSFLLALVGSLAMVNRLDTGLFFLPATIAFVYQNFNWKSLVVMGLGGIPIVGWLLFAWSYYGFIFPNTYYAKLYTGIALSDYIHQGLIYCLDSIQHDPITLLTIAVALLLALVLKHKPSLWLCLGSLLYVLYVIKNGGDFMSGRFFAAPFLLALASMQPILKNLASQIKSNAPTALTLAIATTILIVPTGLAFSKNEDQNNTIPLSGIVNERLFFISTNSLLNQIRSNITPPHPWAQYGADQKAIADQEAGKIHLVNFPNVGMLGFFAGPKVYIVDPLGLTDPFLAHLPIDLTQPWRIGHFIRPIPEGYIESKMTQTNQIKDPVLHDWYEQVQKIINQ